MPEVSDTGGPSALSSFSFEIDPHAVLGVPLDATLEQIRDAYRRKSKMLHPDVGGEEWAFRVLVQSYEMLSSARVLRATQAEPETRRPDAATATGSRPQEPSTESLRGGIHDRDISPERIVGVEHLCVRYQWDGLAYLWLTQKTADEERFLSCSLNLSWPDQDESIASLKDRDVEAIVSSLGEIFDHMVVATRVVTSRSHAEDQKFVGWLSYSNFDRSWKALKMLHDAVRSRRLGMRQWSRDLFISKNLK
jgi:DnaJ domain